MYRLYHDSEWGRPVDDDRRLFEKISLEAFQSGLSWITILRKRESFRRAFAGFDVEAVARFNARSVDRLLNDARIVRHRAKIEATISNARRCVELMDEFDTLAAYVWSFEPDERTRPRRLDRDTVATLTASAESRAMSADLKRRGWRFVGPTTIYAFMEAMGLVNDHLDGCDLREEVERGRSSFVRPSRTRSTIGPPHGLTGAGNTIGRKPCAQAILRLGSPGPE
jgi:DNA-3-methyladenine glycosylase I